MGIGFVILLPFLFWVFIVMLIIAVSNSGRSRRNTQARNGVGSMNNRYGKSQPAIRLNGERPKMKAGLFDMDNDKNRKSTGKGFSFGGMGGFGNSGYDSYETKGRKKDFVSGYDKKLTTSRGSMRRAASTQYSHTYDGHEPWDKCLPKEKDPWDKDFYA